MRPENAADWRKWRAGQALEHSRMTPELELDDIRFARQDRNMIETLGKFDMCASRLDFIDEAPVQGGLKQNESLLHHLW